MYLVYLLLATICNMYFVGLQNASPGTFWGTVFSFSAVWFWLGMLFIVLFLMRRFALWQFIKKRTKIILASVVGALFVIGGINLCFICNPRLADGSENVEYLIVLGGGITKNAELTDSVQARVKVAADYLQRHQTALAVVTGGKGPFSPCPESDVLKPALAAYGIEDQRILAEDKAKDTIQNFQYSIQLLSEHTGKSVEEILSSPIAVVTNDFHLARSERLAKRIGFTEVYGVAARTPLFFRANCYCREICCYIKLNLRILLTGKPSKALAEEPSIAEPSLVKPSLVIDDKAVLD